MWSIALRSGWLTDLVVDPPAPMTKNSDRLQRPSRCSTHPPNVDPSPSFRPPRWIKGASVEMEGSAWRLAKLGRHGHAKNSSTRQNFR